MSDPCPISYVDWLADLTSSVVPCLAPGTDEAAGFIAGVLLATVAGPAGAQQQTARRYRIALVDPVIPVSELSEAAGPTYRGFFEELARLGYVEGRNILIERFSEEGRADHYPELAREVVRLNPDLIYAHSTRMVLDFRASTTITPDPVRLGIVTSMARPGGNFTGSLSMPALGSLGSALRC